MKKYIYFIIAKINANNFSGNFNFNSNSKKNVRYLRATMTVKDAEEMDG